MTEKQTVSAQALARKSASVRSQSKALHAESRKIAMQVAETEQAVAATMDRLASQRPAHAVRLRALGRAAARVAAQERQWHDRHGDGASDVDRGAA